MMNIKKHFRSIILFGSFSLTQATYGTGNAVTSVTSPTLLRKDQIQQNSGRSFSRSLEKNETAREFYRTGNYVLSKLENCGSHIKAPKKTFGVFVDYDFKVQNWPLTNMTGWNHVTNGSSTEWKNIRLFAPEYDFPRNGKKNSTCNDVDTLNMVLVKKIADWDHQHANGFESHLREQGITFDQIDSVVVDLRINSEKTTVPATQKLKETYVDYIAEPLSINWDVGLVNIGLTFYDGSTLKAATIIELDQNSLMNKWLRVTIKLDALEFYSEINYVKTPKTYEDIKGEIVSGMLVVAETRTGSVLRGKIKNWNENVPEMFKEIDLSVKKIEFQFK